MSHNLEGNRTKAEMDQFVEDVKSEVREIELYIKCMISEYIAWACSICDLSFTAKGNRFASTCATLANIRAAWIQNPSMDTTKKLCWVFFYLGDCHMRRVTGKTEAERAEDRILEKMNKEYEESRGGQIKPKGRRRSSFIQQIYTSAFNVSRCNVLRRGRNTLTQDAAVGSCSSTEDPRVFQKIQVTRPKEMGKDNVERRKEEMYLQTFDGKWSKVRKIC